MMSVGDRSIKQHLARAQTQELRLKIARDWAASWRRECDAELARAVSMCERERPLDALRALRALKIVADKRSANSGTPETKTPPLPGATNAAQYNKQSNFSIHAPGGAKKTHKPLDKHNKSA
jgi:predicted component of type VI protein secretion system